MMEGHVHSKKHKGHDQRDNQGMIQGHVHSKKDKGHDQCSRVTTKVKNQGARPEKCSRVTSEVKVQGSRPESIFKGHDQRDN